MKAFAGNIMLTNDIDTTTQNLVGINLQRKTALITGGAGFLGSWICDVLANLGVKVICLDNLSSGLEANISHLYQNKNFKFIKHDITQPFHPNEKIDLVLHMASRASPFEFEKFPLEILKSNTLGTLNSLEIARANEARFLFTSTSETYGNPSIVPTPESYYGNVNAIGIRGDNGYWATVIDAPRDISEHGHGKSVKGIIDALSGWKLSKIYDPFLGSGSTLIACEKTSRTCFGMEIDEYYCDVVIKRWCDYTGNIAKLSK